MAEHFTDADRVRMYREHRGVFDPTDATWACQECYEDSPCDVTRALDYSLELETCIRRIGSDPQEALSALRAETGPRHEEHEPLAD